MPAIGETDPTSKYTAAEMTQRYGSMYTASLESVPPDIFTLGTDRTIPTPSGNKLACFTLRDLVDIHDPSELINPGHDPNVPDDPTYHFSAGIYSSYYGYAIAFDIRNRNPLSETPDVRHPDIHPTALAGRSLDYFQSLGISVRAMQTRWESSHDGRQISADNWLAYRANLAKVKSRWRPVSKEEQHTAALDTKSGRLALRLGFTHLASVKESAEGQIVKCVFIPEQ